MECKLLSFSIIIVTEQLQNQMQLGQVFFILNWNSFTYSCVASLSNRTRHSCHSDDNTTMDCDYGDYLFLNDSNSIIISTNHIKSPLIIDQIRIELHNDNFQFILGSFCIENDLRDIGLYDISNTSTNCMDLNDENEYDSIIMDNNDVISIIIPEVVTNTTQSGLIYENTNVNIMQYCQTFSVSFIVTMDSTLSHLDLTLYWNDDILSCVQDVETQFICSNDSFIAIDEDAKYQLRLEYHSDVDDHFANITDIIIIDLWGNEYVIHGLCSSKEFHLSCNAKLDDNDYQCGIYENYYNTICLSNDDTSVLYIDFSDHVLVANNSIAKVLPPRITEFGIQTTVTFPSETIINLRLYWYEYLYICSLDINQTNGRIFTCDINDTNQVILDCIDPLMLTYISSFALVIDSYGFDGETEIEIDHVFARDETDAQYNINTFCKELTEGDDANSKTKCDNGLLYEYNAVPICQDFSCQSSNKFLVFAFSENIFTDQDDEEGVVHYDAEYTLNENLTCNVITSLIKPTEIDKTSWEEWVIPLMFLLLICGGCCCIGACCYCKGKRAQQRIHERQQTQEKVKIATSSKKSTEHDDDDDVSEEESKRKIKGKDEDTYDINEPIKPLSTIELTLPQRQSLTTDISTSNMLSTTIRSSLRTVFKKRSVTVTQPGGIKKTKSKMKMSSSSIMDGVRDDDDSIGTADSYQQEDGNAAEKEVLYDKNVEKEGYMMETKLQSSVHLNVIKSDQPLQIDGNADEITKNTEDITISDEQVAQQDHATNDGKDENNINDRNEENKEENKDENSHKKGKTEDVLLDGMLEDVLKMQSLDPNKIKQISVLKNISESGSDDSDDIYENSDNDQIENDNEGNNNNQ